MEKIFLTIDGKPVEAAAGSSVATAMLASDVHTFSRSVKYHRPRGPFCLSGDCGSCLVRVDGRPSVRACVTPCEPGMLVERQNAFPSVDVDLLAAADLLFPGGMDHHTLGTWPRPLNLAIQRVVRQVAGLGRLPDACLGRTPAELPAPESRRVDVFIVGAGPAGLGCAEVLAESGYRVLLVDGKPQAGGSYWAAPGASAERARISATLGRIDYERRAVAIAYYPEDRPFADGPIGLHAVATPRGLVKVSSRITVYATGSYDQNLLFVDNDRPGIVAARGLLRLITQEGFRPRGLIAVVGDEAAAAGALFAEYEVPHVVLPPGSKLVAAKGRKRVSSVVYEHGGAVSYQKCDWLAIASRPSPASELGRQHGCTVYFDDRAGGFVVGVDAVGRTSVEDVYACGDITGYRGAVAAAASGRQTAQAVLRRLEAVTT